MTRARGRSTGFTFVELLAVFVVLAAVSITAVPAFTSLSGLRDASLAREVGRRINLARAMAGAWGQPTGVRFDVAAQTVSVVRIAPGDAGATAVPGMTGAGSSDGDVDGRIARLFPGGSIVSVRLSPDGGHDTLWFNYLGVPHLRDESGAMAGPLAEEAVIELSGERSVRVHPVTGLVE